VDHNGGSNVVVVCHAATAAALASHCLHLGPEGLPLMRCEHSHVVQHFVGAPARPALNIDAAGVSIVDFH
jgi:hypothetical protein